MKIQLAKPDGFRGQGRKDNQEDDYAPKSLSAKSRFFILCDGMGGHEKGEIASKTVCEALEHFFSETPPDNYEISESYFDKAIEYAYKELDKKDTEPDSGKKMGTTLTCVYFGDNGALVAHIGDSRVYQIRPSDYTPKNYRNAVKIKTKDHSLVRQLIDVGEITEEQAKTYPKRNVITKCMQPHDEYNMPDYDSCDVKTGDYFFLCSDGVLENITTEILCQVLAENISDQQKKEKLQSLCDGNTKDNYTGILLHVIGGDLPAVGDNSQIEIATDDDSDKDSDNKSDDTVEISLLTSVIEWIKNNLKTAVFIVVVSVCALWLLTKIKSCVNPTQNTEQKDKSGNEKPSTNDSIAPAKKTKDAILGEIKSKFKECKDLGLDMSLLSNPKSGRLVLLNNNSLKTYNLTNDSGKIAITNFNGNDAVLNEKKIVLDDFKIYDFAIDTTTNDTVAQIVWTVEKETRQQPAKTIRLKINSKGEVIKN